ncbi:MAG: sigma-70 family RNA polymerase sigma factor [Solirubrobacteraceae bacterium]
MAHEWPARSLSDRQQERLLFERYRATGDAATRELIVKRNLALASSVASRYNRTSVPHDDRMQVACVALLKAIDRFDPDRGVAFSSFAIPTMVGELQRYFRDYTWMVRPRRELQERVLRLERTTEALSGELGRAPTGPELARATGLSLEEVLETLQATHARGSASLDQPAGLDQDETLAATIGEEDAQYRQVENAILAEDLLSELMPREQQMLRLRFERDLTQSEIGALVGCSQMQVCRTIRAALDQLSASAAAERFQLLAAV